MMMILKIDHEADDYYHDDAQVMLILMAVIMRVGQYASMHACFYASKPFHLYTCVLPYMHACVPACFMLACTHARMPIRLHA